MGWLEQPPSGWWPGAGRRRGLEERTQTPCQGESWPRPPALLTASLRSEEPAVGSRPAPVPSRRCCTPSSLPGLLPPLCVPGQGLTLLPVQAEAGDMEPGRPLSWGGWLLLTGERAGCQRPPRSFSTVPPLPFPSQRPEPGRSTLPNPLSAGGRCLQWRLRSRRLLNKFRCLGGRSELPSEAAGRGAGPVESRDRARTVFWPGKEGGVEDKRGVAADVTQSRGFPLPPVMEERNKKGDPRERPPGHPREGFQRSPPKSRRAWGEVTLLRGNGEPSVEDLNETILKDHCYCAAGETRLSRCTPRPCPLREHDYCRNRKVGVSALKDHEYCHVQRIRYRGRANKTGCLTGKARAMLRRLAKRKSHVGRIIRKARRIMWHYKPCVNKRLDLPQGSSSTGCLSEPAVPPAEAEDGPTKGAPGAFRPPAEREAVPPQPRGEGGSQGATSEALCAPAVSFGPAAAPPPSNAAGAVKREATRPEASVHRQAQRAQRIWSPDAKRSVEGGELVRADYVSLHDAYEMVMRTVDHMLGSVCQNFELSGYSRRKDIWPVIIRIDS